MSPRWVTELVRLAVVLALGALLGIALGSVSMALAIVLAAFLAWHLAQLWRLERWVSRSNRFAPPEADGIWGVVFQHLWHMRQQDRARKRRFAHVLRAFRDATAAMPDGTVALDRNLEVLWCNAAAETLLPVRMPQDRGQRIANLVRHPSFVRFIAARGEREPIEIPMPHAPDRWLLLHLVEYGDDQHLLLVRDSTRVHRLEQMRREFVANASHELRSPLTVVSGYLEVLADDREVAASWGTQVEEMRRQARRMLRIVTDLLELSRLETDALPPARRFVDVPGLLARIRREALALGVGPQEIALDADPDLGLLGDESELYSAISNLVFNAMHYTPREGSVRVGWHSQAGSPTLAVADTGVGIGPEHLPRLTERFYRVDASRSRARGGTGLGLAIVKHVAQRHGAALAIESQPGAGSTFTIRFPARRLAPRL
jgi:two-component system phosphate regulon sensor histidine kinase PhoR